MLCFAAEDVDAGNNQAFAFYFWQSSVFSDFANHTAVSFLEEVPADSCQLSWNIANDNVLPDSNCKVVKWVVFYLDAKFFAYDWSPQWFIDMMSPNSAFNPKQRSHIIGCLRFFAFLSRLSTREEASRWEDNFEAYD